MNQSSETKKKLLNSTVEKKLELLAKVRAKKNTIGLIKYFHPEYIFNHVHQEISDTLAQMEDGLFRNLILMLPPRHHKSEFVSRYFPARIMGKYANQQIIAASHTAEFADKLGREVRDIMDQPRFAALYGVKLAQDSQAKNRWHTSNGGEYHAVGVGGGVTGIGAHWIIIDDPHKDRMEVDSQLTRERVIEWYKSTLYTRQMPGCKKILVMQRWHEEDLAGYLIKQMADGGEQWRVIKYSAINEKGEALFPEWFPLEQLLLAKAQGSRAWASQWQQEPNIEGGNIVQQSWFKYYNPDSLDRLDEMIQSWDLKFSNKATEGSYVVGQVWGRLGIDYYLLDQFRRRVGYTETKRAILDLSARWPDAKRKLVENKANGPALEDDLRTELTGIVLTEPDGDKKARLYSVTPCMETSHVYLPNNAAWVQHDYIPELIRFTGNKTEINDQVDCTSQALHYFEERKGGANKFQVITISNNPIPDKSKNFLNSD